MQVFSTVRKKKFYHAVWKNHLQNRLFYVQQRKREAEDPIEVTFERMEERTEEMRVERTESVQEITFIEPSSFCFILDAISLKKIQCKGENETEIHRMALGRKQMNVVPHGRQNWFVRYISGTPNIIEEVI